MPSLSYQAHPLYKLRLATCITGFVGFFLNIFAMVAVINDSDSLIPFFVFSLFLLIISFFFCLHDLVTYAASHAPFRSTEVRRRQESEEWPSRRLLIIDLVLAIVFQWLFWIGFFAIISSFHYNYYNKNGVETFEAYANLVNFIVSIEHAVAFYKELMARKKTEWKADLERQPCANCGHTEEQPAVEDGQRLPSDSASNRGTSDMGHLHGGKDKTTMPKWSKDTSKGTNAARKAPLVPHENEPLLDTPDGSTTETSGPSGTYGTLTMEDSVASVGSVLETIVKKKEKGKKRVVDV
ncbi:hypothetical protein BDV95DRAFT_584701, partial [Massariosphaeria phaeospora]